jgi:hypothetical protein
MEVKDKALLIKDLCGRLPYGVYVEHIRTGMRGHLHDLKVYPLYDKTDDHIYDYICSTDFLGDGDYFDIEAFKPLLFPLSSITIEQEKELLKLGVSYGEYALHDDTRGLGIMVDEAYIFFEFCYKHHIDFLGLIEMGLAIDATGQNVY